MSWNISVTTVIGGGGNRPGIYAGKFSPIEFHDLPFLVKLPVGSLFLQTSALVDCGPVCQTNTFQKTCSDCGSSSWRAMFDIGPASFSLPVDEGLDVGVKIESAAPTWSIDWGDGSQIEQVANGGTLSHTYGVAYTGLVTIYVAGGVGQIELLWVEGRFNFTFADLIPLTGLKYLTAWLGNLVTGNLADLNDGLLSFAALNDCAFQGNISDLPAGLIKFQCHGTEFSTFTGNIADLPAGLTQFNADGANDTYGDVSNLPSSLTHYFNEGLNLVNDITGGLPPLIESFVDRTPVVGFTGEEVDAMMAALVANGPVPNGRLEIQGNNSPPTAAGAADKATLVGAGWTIFLN